MDSSEREISGLSSNAARASSRLPFRAGTVPGERRPRHWRRRFKRRREHPGGLRFVPRRRHQTTHHPLRIPLSRTHAIAAFHGIIARSQLPESAPWKPTLVGSFQRPGLGVESITCHNTESNSHGESHAQRLHAGQRPAVPGRDRIAGGARQVQPIWVDLESPTVEEKGWISSTSA